MHEGRWMAVDWSAGRLRVWVIGADGDVLDREEADVTGLTAYETGLAPIIAHHLDDDDGTDILVTGDPSAPDGWGDGVCAKVPCTPPGPDATTRVEARDDRLHVNLVTGVRQDDPPGLMLADAVRIRGFLALNDTFDGVICLAGPRTRWVHISAGEIVSFQSFVTGDFIATAFAAMGNSGQPGAGLGDAVASAISKPEAVAARIGALEAGHRLGTVPDQTIRDEVWGLFLGLELAAARPYWLGQRVALIGSGDRMAAYRTAMQVQGVLLEEADEEEAMLAGFRAIRGA